MSTQRLAILAAVGTHNLMRNTSETGGGGTERHHHGRDHHQAADQQRSPNQFHGNVNVLLGGAMLSVVVTMVCFVCYCCHRNLRKRSETVYRQRWFDADANMEIYSVAQCYDLSPEQRISAAAAAAAVAAASDLHHQPASLTPSLAMSAQGPPPSYDTVVAMDQSLDGCDKCAQMSRSCSYANCHHLYQQQQQQLHSHNCRRPFVIKADHELNNNANRTDSMGAAAVAATTNTAQILSVLEVTASTAAQRVVHCNCNLYQPCCGGVGVGPVDAVDRIDTAHHIEFVQRCKHCGGEFDANYYCDCFSAVTVSSPASLVGATADATRNPTNSHVETDGVDDNANTVDNGNGSGCTALIASTTAAAAAAAEAIVRPSTSANNNRADGTNSEESDNGSGAGARAVAPQCAAPNCAGTVHQPGNINQQHQQQHQQQQCGCGCIGGPDNGRNVDLEAFSAAGLIRMDMSQIIDQTGLPTYEAALKFESSGYV